MAPHPLDKEGEKDKDDDGADEDGDDDLNDDVDGDEEEAERGEVQPFDDQWCNVLDHWLTGWVDHVPYLGKQPRRA